MNATSKMVTLLGELRREMNGAVVDSMREKGIEYALSYGVSIPTVRALARQYAPDDELARLSISSRYVNCNSLLSRSPRPKA